jgi:hypothetical protein
MSNWPGGLWTRRSQNWLPPRISYSSGFASAPVCTIPPPPPDRIVKIMSRVRQLSALKFCQAREFISLIGLLSSAADQIPHGIKVISPTSSTSPTLQIDWPHQDPLDQEIPLPESLLWKVWKFWDSETYLYQWVLLQPPPPKLSNFGWGAHVNEVDLTTKGTWSEKEVKMSINILELKAVLLGVSHFRNHLKNQRVFRQRGIHSPVLCRMTWELLQFCRCENMVLVPRHIPGKHNILTDALSKSNKLVSTKWTLHIYVVQAVRDLWGSPTIDLFATKMNNCLPQYMSPLPDPKALAVNTLAV